MYEKEKECMTAISQYAGKRPDYIQGGGGNTSYKFDDQLMAIKASGYSLKGISDNEGYVTVDYSALKSAYTTLLAQADVDVEAESLKHNIGCIRTLERMESKRPSVEVGFHAFLPRAVVHTHSVYANILACATEGKKTAEDIFKDSGLDFISIPFISPGFRLAMHIKDKTEAFKRLNGKTPDVIIMESHGIVVSNDDCQAAIALHENANRLIADHFNCTPFPVPQIKALGTGFQSHTPFLKEFIKAYKANEAFFDQTILYPDQMVYLSRNLGKTIKIDLDTGDITYETSEKLAQTLEETILGVSYIISEINRCGLTLKTLCEEGINFIKNWEGEKYRVKIATE